MKQFEPLTLDLIDEGTFVVQGNADLLRLQKDLLEYVEAWGEQAKGAKATLVLKVTLRCDNPEHEVYSIKTDSELKLPRRPSTVSNAIADMTEDNKPALFVRRSGSDAGDPRQKKLATHDGRVVNEDGELED